MKDPYTVSLQTVGFGGTVIGNAATILVWLVLGVLVGRYYRLRQFRNAEEDEQCKAEIAGGSTTIGLASVVGRRARAKQLEKELDNELLSKSTGENHNNEEEEEEEEEGEDATDDSGEWTDEESTESDTEDLENLRLKMVLIVRKDLPMTANDVAMRSASAAVGVISHIYKTQQTAANGDESTWWRWYLWWNRVGVTKIALRCPDASEMMRLQELAVRNNLPYFVEGDAVLAVGPAPSDNLEPVSGGLKLLS